MLNCIIVDDEDHVRNSLFKMLALFCPDVKVIDVASNIKDAKALIEQHSPDLVFLDVEMPGGSGFELLESIDNIEFQIVFTTAHAAYAIKAIKYAAMDYLLKPLNSEELKDAVERCESSKENIESIKKQVDVLKVNRQNEDFHFSKIALPTADGMEFFDLENIIRCEADRAYCKFHLVNKKKVHISKPMSEYHDILAQANFIKVHKSNIVNIGHVTKYLKGNGGELMMSDGSLINVAVRRKEEVLNALKLTKK